MSNALFPCCACERRFGDISSFSAHFKVAHQECRKFACKIKNCSRSYGAYYTFRRHLIIHHHYPLFALKDVPSVVSKIRSSNKIHETIFVSNFLDIAVQSNNCDMSSDESNSNTSLVNYDDLLLREEDCFVAKLYHKAGLPRNFVDTMISDISNYLNSPFIDNMENVVTASLDKNLSPQRKKEIITMFDRLRHPFDHLQTEYKRFQYFKSCGAYIEPISYEIDSCEQRIRSKDGETLGMKSVLGQYIPVDKLLINFFELPHVLEDTLSYMEYLKKDSDWICNLTQCEVWKRKRARFEATDIVIPLNIYYDEVEPNSALGPHCEPLGCTYMQVATLPLEWLSKLENIFLVLLFDGNNRKIYSNKKAFRPLLQGLKDLEKFGVSVTVPGLGTHKIYFVVALILGDNLALNGVCGFTESFVADHYCRVCVCTKAAAMCTFVEDETLLRTAASYQEAVALKDPEVTGIKEPCIFECLPSFVAPTDIAVDSFHDVIEGVAHYTMVPVLKHFHALNNMFITTLNNRMYNLPLGIDGDNRPPLINLDRLLTKDKLKMTGAEMATFVRIFGVLVKDMIPNDDLYYNLYLLLLDILSIVQAKKLPKNVSVILLVKVKEHNKLYVQLTKENLKAKHHFLLHYPRLLRMIGPFNLVSTIRFEAKHRQITLTADSCMSRVNLSKTVSIKQQLAFSYRCLSNFSLRQDIDHGPRHLLNLKDLDAFPSFSLTLPDVIFNEPMQSVVNWVTYKGTTYKPKQVVLYSVVDGLPQFSEIELIIIYEGKPLFICSCLDTVGYFTEVRGYQVKRMLGVINWFAIDQDRLYDYNPLCLFHMSSGELVIVPKYYL